MRDWAGAVKIVRCKMASEGSRTGAVEGREERMVAQIGRRRAKKTAHSFETSLRAADIAFAKREAPSDLTSQPLAELNDPGKVLFRLGYNCMISEARGN